MKTSSTSSAVCYSVLQRVAACCSVWQRVEARCNVLQHVAACCSVLQRVAACCNESCHTCNCIICAICLNEMPHKKVLQKRPNDKVSLSLLQVFVVGLFDLSL